MSRTWIQRAIAACLLPTTAAAGVEMQPPTSAPPMPQDIRVTIKSSPTELDLKGLDIVQMLGAKANPAEQKNAQYILRASIAGTRQERKKTEVMCREQASFAATIEGWACSFEHLDAQLKASPAKTVGRSKGKKKSSGRVRNPGEWNATAELSFRDAMRLINPKTLEDAKRFGPWALAAGCKTPMAGAALLNQTEEFLPDSDAWALMESLYTTLADCLDPRDPIHEQAHLHMGLLQIHRGDFEAATAALNRALQNQTPAEEYRTLFWRGFLENEPGKATSTIDLKWNKYWERLIANYPLTQHSVLLHGIFGEHPLDTSRQEPPVPSPFQGKTWDSANLTNLIFSSLLAENEGRIAREFSSRIAGKVTTENIPQGMYMAMAHRAAGNLRESMRITYSFAKGAGAEALHANIIRLLYPVMYDKQVARHAGESLEVPLALSLMRQESSFNPRAKSPAGAAGLMQVLPRTAKRTTGQLLDPDTNIAAGCRYLRSQLRSFDGNEVLTLAAYNAGPTAVGRWLKRYPGASPLLYADMIPYAETRAYVSGVLRGRFWYRYQLDGVNEETHAQKELLYASHLLGFQLVPDLASRKSSGGLLSFLARKPLPGGEVAEPLYAEEM